MTIMKIWGVGRIHRLEKLGEGLGWGGEEGEGSDLTWGEEERLGRSGEEDS